MNTQSQKFRKNLGISFKKSRVSGFVNPENPGILNFRISRLASLIHVYVNDGIKLNQKQKIMKEKRGRRKMNNFLQQTQFISVTFVEPNPVQSLIPWNEYYSRTNGLKVCFFFFVFSSRFVLFSLSIFFFFLLKVQLKCVKTTRLYIIFRRIFLCYSFQIVYRIY